MIAPIPNLGIPNALASSLVAWNVRHSSSGTGSPSAVNTGRPSPRSRSTSAASASRSGASSRSRGPRASRSAATAWRFFRRSTASASLEHGAEGELISRGPTNAVGYWEQPEETAATFRDGWVWTGDLGHVLPDGAIVLTGRKKELIRSGGESFSPKEVEDLLTTHPAISQAFVVGLPDD